MPALGMYLGDHSEQTVLCQQYACTWVAEIKRPCRGLKISSVYRIRMCSTEVQHGTLQYSLIMAHTKLNSTTVSGERIICNVCM
jgi:hypothetical protein